MGRPAIKITGGGGVLELVYVRPTLALASALVHQTKQLRTTQTKRIKHKREAEVGGRGNKHYISLEGMASQIYPAELQLNIGSTSDTEASF